MMPNIYYISPYSLDFHYGKEINKHIEAIPNDAWIVLTDYDTLWLTPNYGRVIHNAILTYGDSTDLFTCQTNRLGSRFRCYMDEISNNTDILHHMRIARSLERENGHKCEVVKDRIVAGMCMIFPKRVWLENKFDDHPILYEANAKITSFDVRWVAGIHGNIRKIIGLYLWHSYRLDKTNISLIDHLKE